MHRKTLYTFAVVGFAVLVAGCGGTYDATAEGIVTLNGSTLPYGWIAFHPKAGGPAAYARVAENGSYVVSTGSEQGLPPGDYQVTITANEPPKESRGKDGRPAASGKLITPAWYGLKEQSGLEVTVKPGKNDIPLTLNSTPPAGWKAGAKK
jgi:hypothetical protein